MKPRTENRNEARVVPAVAVAHLRRWAKAMFSLRVRGEFAASELVLVEIGIQCKIAIAAHARLEEYARIQISRDYASKAPHPKSVVDLFSDCSVFLSAAGVISKFLFPRSKKPSPTARKRSKKLRELLGVTNCPVLKGLRVRNAFEHIDERLDDELKQNPAGTFIQYHVTRTPPPEGLVLKRFDPNSRQLSYLNSTLDLNGCISEIRQIEIGLKNAHEKIREQGGLH